MIDEKSALAQDHLSVRWQNMTSVGWYAAALFTLIILIASIPGYIQAVSNGLGINQFSANPSPVVVAINAFVVLVSFTTALLSLYLAFLLFRLKSRDRMALFLSFFLLAFSLSVGPVDELHQIAGAGKTYFIWDTIFTPLILYPAFIFLFLLFPDGRFASDWSRRLGLASLVTAPVSTIAYIIFDHSNYHLIAAEVVGSIPPVMVLLGVLYAQYDRYRHIASGQQRQQIKWLVYGLAVMLFFLTASAFPYIWSFTLPDGATYPVWLAIDTVLYILSFPAFPVSLTIAVMRYRLYDIDNIINHTLVYGVLTASTMGIYVFGVGLVGNLFEGQHSTIIAFLTTGVVALLFQPIRERLQSAVNHLMYGERSDPVSVLSRLGKQLEETLSPRDALDGMVTTVAQALKLPYVAIEFGNGDKAQMVAACGQKSVESVRLPIGYQGQIIGSLLVAQRSPGESFDEQDNILLENIARQAGAAAHAAKLTADLQRSRQGLVTAREEERRRLRRDLHDGIGPTMAGQTLKLDAAIDLILGDPDSGQDPDLDEAVKLLLEMKEQTQETVKNIRQIVYALRPPSLDDLGLVAAIQAHIGQLSVSRHGLAFFLEVTPQDFPRLSAAVEVATYRIVLEALTNVIIHAQAQECVVKLSVPEVVDKTLYIEVKDDGIGFSNGKSHGVGLTSIRERVEELGGSLTIQSSKLEGTRLLAQIPLFLAEP